ncbi:hypothetical protein HY967_01135 [Candidatus Jorgensenbacteria bacterium]|nr:hypothetical protein [Candidatus Jorgensenbacteria bacterium]
MSERHIETITNDKETPLETTLITLEKDADERVEKLVERLLHEKHRTFDKIYLDDLIKALTGKSLIELMSGETVHT